MKYLLRLEELAQFLLILLVLVMKGAARWVYPLLLLGPDIGMVGYLVGTRTGAFTYNLTHHKGIALLLMLIGLVVEMANMLANVQSGYFLAGLILYGHSALDRMLGFGLKFGDHFQHTHLGWIGGYRKTDN